MSTRPPTLLRLLLRLFPGEFREGHAEELSELMLEERRHPRWDGRLGGLRFRLHWAGDLIRAAARLRWRPPAAAAPVAPAAPRGVSMRACLRDLRFGVRSLARTPFVSGVICLTLALGIGMNTAIFSAVDGVLLQPLPYRDAQRLVSIRGRVRLDSGERRVPLAGAALRDLRESAPALEAVAAATSISQNLTGGGAPLLVEVGWVSNNLFELLGVPAALGRVFRDGDGPGALLLGHGLWLRQFGGDPAVIGRGLSLDGHAYTVIGVLPPGFQLHAPGVSEQVDVWKNPDDWWQNGDVWQAGGLSFGILSVLGRTAEGAAASGLAGQLDSLAARYRGSDAEFAAVGFQLEADPLHEVVTGEARPTLLLLLGAVGCVLLIACANVMNLLLVRAQARRREIALRLALGSSRAGVVRLLLSEGLLLAAGGGGLGVLLGVAGTRALTRLRPPGLPRSGDLGVDASVLGFAAACALGCVLLFALAPALGAARRDLTRDLGGGRGSAGPAAQRVSRGLVALQLALSLVLLIGAGLLTASLGRLDAVRPGFATEDRLTFQVSLPGTRYPRPVGTNRFFRELERRVAALPGVRSVGVVWPLPLSGPFWSGSWVAGDVPAEANAHAAYLLATPAFFEAAEIPLLEGRAFEDGDPREVVVVSRSLARRAWPGRSALGRSLEANPWGGERDAYRVVGVADDVRSHSLREAGGEAVWFDSRGWSWSDWEVDYLVHAAVTPESLVEPIRAVLLELDPEIPLARARPFSEYVDRQLATPRFALLLIGMFAGVAALLALVGLYGVVAYSVGQRTREIGIRMALGAERHRILRLVLGQGLRLAGVGLLLGLAGSWALTRLLAALLFGVAPQDPATFVAMALALAGVAVFACYPPARRAARLDPARTLRAE